ncbi:MAG: manganese efflux pump MntP family protein [Clostridiaceae bacterium]|nr:manganese efflux pump MntP family protein [Clostridiaceae bacterium]
MSLLELFILAVGLSMDAFAVSMCKGFAIEKVTLKKMFTAGAYFGGFQAGMPLLGYVLGVGCSNTITSVDHWIAFALLTFIGGNMIRGSFSKKSDDGCKTEDASMSPKSMLLLAVATSIDALAVGVTLAFLQVSILPSVTFIGCTTFVLSAFGIYLGHKLGSSNKLNAELWGGIILVLIGCKILFGHLGIIG